MDVGPCDAKAPEEDPRCPAVLPLRRTSAAMAAGDAAEEGSDGASGAGLSFGVLCGVGDLEEQAESLRM